MSVIFIIPLPLFFFFKNPQIFRFAFERKTWLEDVKTDLTGSFSQLDPRILEHYATRVTDSLAASIIRQPAESESLENVEPPYKVPTWAEVVARSPPSPAAVSKKTKPPPTETKFIGGGKRKLSKLSKGFKKQPTVQVIEG